MTDVWEGPGIRKALPYAVRGLPYWVLGEAGSLRGQEERDRKPDPALRRMERLLGRKIYVGLLKNSENTGTFT